MERRVVIDPSSRMAYSSYYIRGLCSLFGENNVSYSNKFFKELKRNREPSSFDHYMAFVVLDIDNTISKYIIDFRDKTSIKERAYHWCEVYAKINFNLKLTKKEYHDKIISIPPGFGIKIWNFWETAYYCISNLIKVRFSPIKSMRVHFSDYREQYKRASLESYLSSASQVDLEKTSPYVFMIATLWPDENCLEGTNLLRKTFVEICKSSNCKFEGGFWASKNHPQYSDFKDLIFSKRYTTDEYIDKTKLSSIVFNTPAVHNCHGWKLGEYLAMGKAIISTSITNELPEQLVHGENIYVIENMNELKYALEILFNNDTYRTKLSKGAKDYYSKYASPNRVIEQVLKGI